MHWAADSTGLNGVHEEREWVGDTQCLCAQLSVSDSVIILHLNLEEHVLSSSTAKLSFYVICCSLVVRLHETKIDPCLSTSPPVSRSYRTRHSTQQ